MQKFNHWEVPFCVISFFEKAMEGHSKVMNINRKEDIFFTIKDVKGRIFKVLLLNEYCIGLATVLKALDDFPETEYIVTGGNWNGYTKEAKEYCSENDLGLFNLGEFLGAINWTKPKDYYKKDSDGKPSYPFKSA